MKKMSKKNRITQMTYREWVRQTKLLFGEDSSKWRFKCPSCGHVQSIESIREHDPSLKIDDVAQWIQYHCEGRTNKGQGCDWSLGGLFHIHTLEIITDGESHPSFEFAEVE